jgi:hypothetical protein
LTIRERPRGEAATYPIISLTNKYIHWQRRLDERLVITIHQWVFHIQNDERLVIVNHRWDFHLQLWLPSNNVISVREVAGDLSMGLMQGSPEVVAG